MFKVIVIVTTLAGHALGYGVSGKDYATKPECDRDVQARVEAVTKAIPGANSYKGMCIDKATIEAIVRKLPLPKGHYAI